MTEHFPNMEPVVKTEYGHETQEDPINFRSADGELLYMVFLDVQGAGLLHNSDVQDAKGRLIDIYMSNQELVRHCASLNMAEAKLLLMEQENNNLFQQAA